MEDRTATLFPGYRHVANFGPEVEYKEEEEVSYVTLDIGSVEPTLVPSTSSYRLIGLDTSTPYLQLSGTTLKGRHLSLLGTELIFAEGDIEGSNTRNCVHVANIEQRIRFHEVQIVPKNRDDSTLNPLPQRRDKGKAKATTVSTGLDHEIPENLVNILAGTVPSLARKRRAGRKPKKLLEKEQNALELQAGRPDDQLDAMKLDGAMDTGKD